MNQRPLDLQSNALPNYAITAYKYNILCLYIDNSEICSEIGIIAMEYSEPGRSEKQKVCFNAGWRRRIRSRETIQYERNLKGCPRGFCLLPSGPPWKIE